MDDVRGLHTYPDASGAPCLIDVRGTDGIVYTYACDLVGQQTIRLLNTNGTRLASKIAAGIARAKYAAVVATLGDEYVRRNRELYSDT